MIGVAVLGATGTIGVNTLDVIRRHADDYQVVALTAHSQYDRLAVQCEEFNPAYAVMVDEQAAEKLQAILKLKAISTQVLHGSLALEQVVQYDDVDVVMAAIVGAAGLQSTLAAAQAGKKILLANKESLVMSGKLFMDQVRDHNAILLPIDSEHNAIFQCMPNDYAAGLDKIGVTKILLTGSGGPFRELPMADFPRVTPEQAIAHPNWSMGKKISVDSATMMNKGLELIEACWLFDTDLSKIKIVLHPQSIVHSMVEYVDGSVLAQLGQPDMRTPIAHGLAWPDRIESGVSMLDLVNMPDLEFIEPDLQRYPCLRLAKEAMQTGGTATAILNAANEVAVQAFLDKKLNFTDISKTVEYVLEQITARTANTIETVVSEDERARIVATEFIDTTTMKAGVVN
ncbi:1-deoxy-D-xylulose 5-phosphate reductoisomerase [hydrothermal vent metagenome]|uniref:1-deoxy-D-xylulose-5-phosphate reductoisomerase n=1 Tax=hydrothermal vent metagenome TaxID=652676 RepID=A0A3B0ZYY9_9ZZZZ